MFLIVLDNIVYYIFYLQQILLTSNNTGIWWSVIGSYEEQNKLKGLNPAINIIEHNWLNDHQGNAYMRLDWLHRCHLIIKRWHLEWHVDEDILWNFLMQPIPLFQMPAYAFSDPSYLVIFSYFLVREIASHNLTWANHHVKHLVKFHLLTHSYFSFLLFFYTSKTCQA